MHIAIIGNGISGISAARWIRKLNESHQITVISAETDHFFSRTALMYIYMGHMRYKDTQPYESWFWKKNRIDLKKGYVKEIDFENKRLIFDLKPSKVLKDNTPPAEMSYDKLILATGSSPNKFGWPGQDLDGVGGLYSYQDLERMERHSPNLKRAVIVGGGLIGIEMAEMFASRNTPVTMLVRESSFWNNALPAEESAMINRHILEHHIDLRLETELKEIIDDGNGKACAIITNTGERIDCGFVGLTAGVSPNIKFLKETALETQRGIVVDEYLQTNIPDVYAIGDCAQMQNPLPGRRPVEAIWYTGRMMGETLAYTICQGARAYNPGIWFNSAKFLDIEYQVYGEVQAHPPENHQSIYWEHSDGKKSIRIVYDKDSQKILGFNLMGVRYRHEVCEKWLAQETPIEEVLSHLGLANFDPEFYREYEAAVLNIYNQQTGASLSLKQKRGLRGVFSFLKS